jgi:hypothetical protein
VTKPSPPGRQARLAAALRDNLKRRKAHSRTKSSAVSGTKPEEAHESQSRPERGGNAPEGD